MKKLFYALLKKYWLYVIIVGALLLFFLFGNINSCNNKKVEQTTQAVSVNTITQHVIDSIVSKAVNDTVSKLEEKIQARDIVINKRAKIIKNRDNKITQLTNDYNSALEAYKNDTTHTSPCDSLASISSKIITEQKIQNDSLKGQVSDYKQQANDYKQQASSLQYLVDQKNKTIVANNQSIDILEKVAKRTWLEKNDSWIGLILGGIIGFAAGK